MKIRHFYLALALLGLFIPNSAFWSWLLAHGLSPTLFVQDLFANGVSAFFALDVVLSALVLTGFVLVEGRRLGLKQRWLAIAATFIVGVSLGLPLFLYQRQLHLERTAA